MHYLTPLYASQGLTSQSMEPMCLKLSLQTLDHNGCQLTKDLNKIIFGKQSPDLPQPETATTNMCKQSCSSSIRIWNELYHNELCDTICQSNKEEEKLLIALSKMSMQLTQYRKYFLTSSAHCKKHINSLFAFEEKDLEKNLTIPQCLPNRP